MCQALGHLILMELTSELMERKNYASNTRVKNEGNLYSFLMTRDCFRRDAPRFY